MLREFVNKDALSYMLDIGIILHIVPRPYNVFKHQTWIGIVSIFSPEHRAIQCNNNSRDSVRIQMLTCRNLQGTS